MNVCVCVCEVNGLIVVGAFENVCMEKGLLFCSLGEIF
jgi:hypothetical protein